jgi:hypothetical protein
MIIIQKLFPYLATGFSPMERLGGWDARKLGSLRICNLKKSTVFELSSLIASQPPGNTLTFEL